MSGEKKTIEDEGAFKFQIPGGIFGTTFFAASLIWNFRLLQTKSFDRWNYYFDRLLFSHILKFLGKRLNVSNIKLYLQEVHPSLPNFSSYAIKYQRHKVSGVQSAFGKSLDSASEAMSKSLGEFLERYFTHFGFSEEEKPKTLPMNHHSIPQVLFTHTPSYFDWQTKYIPNGWTKREIELGALSSKTVSCVEGESLFTNEKVHLPIQLALYGHESINDYAQRCNLDYYTFRHETTSGGGGGFTLEEATLSGIYELIERDSFFIYWLNGLSPRQIAFDPEILVGEIKGVYDKLTQNGYQVYCLDTTTDVKIPTCITILIGNTGGETFLALGGSCNADPGKAISHSLLEAVSIANTVVQNKKGSDHYFDEEHPFSDFRVGQHTRMYNLWKGEQVLKEIAFFLRGDRISYMSWANEFKKNGIYEDEKEELKFVLSLFKQLDQEHGGGYEVFRYTVNDLILDTLDYHVVKMVVPSLFPLYLVEPYATLDSDRLRNIPVKLRLSAKEKREYSVYPHPFS